MIRSTVYEDTLFKNDQVAIEATGHEDGGITLRVKVGGNHEVRMPLTLSELAEIADNFGLLNDLMDAIANPDPDACPDCGHARYPSTIAEGELLCPFCHYGLSDSHE